jgi:hypothetical protein
MPDLITLICAFVVDLLQSRAALEAEVLVLRQQIVVLRRRKPTRPPLGAIDGLMLGWLCWLIPNTRERRGSAGDGAVLALRRCPLVLALEIEPPIGSSGGFGGDPRVDPRDEPGQSAVGSTADPW